MTPRFTSLPKYCYMCMHSEMDRYFRNITHTQTNCQWINKPTVNERYSQFHDVWSQNTFIKLSSPLFLLIVALHIYTLKLIRCNNKVPVFLFAISSAKSLSHSLTGLIISTNFIPFIIQSKMIALHSYTKKKWLHIFFNRECIYYDILS